MIFDFFNRKNLGTNYEGTAIFVQKMVKPICRIMENNNLNWQELAKTHHSYAMWATLLFVALHGRSALIVSEPEQLSFFAFMTFFELWLAWFYYKLWNPITKKIKSIAEKDTPSADDDVYVKGEIVFLTIFFVIFTFVVLPVVLAFFGYWELIETRPYLPYEDYLLVFFWCMYAIGLVSTAMLSIDPKGLFQTQKKLATNMV